MPDATTLAEVKAVLSPTELAGAFVALDSFDDTADEMPDGAYFARLEAHAEKFISTLPRGVRIRLKKKHLYGHDLIMAWIQQSPKWKDEVKRNA